MRRTLPCAVIICTLVLWLCSCTRTPGSYFPLDQGSEWKYACKSSSQTGELNSRIVAKEQLDKGMGSIFKIERGATGDEGLELYEEQPWGIYAHKRIHPIINYVETTLVPPQPFLKLPLKVGDAWDWKGKIFGMESTSQFKVESRENLQVGGKSLSCFKVLERAKTSDGRELICYRWYAAGYGMVKEESNMTLGTEERENASIELVDYHMGPQ